MLKFDHGNCSLNIRSVAVIIYNNHVLLHRCVKDNFWALPGGRVEFFENADETIVREMTEELALKVRVIRPLWYVENFFEYQQQKYHEISTYFLTELLESERVLFGREFKGVEQSEHLRFKWLPLYLVSNINLKPAILKTKLLRISEHLEYIKINELKMSHK